MPLIHPVKKKPSVEYLTYAANQLNAQVTHHTVYIPPALGNGAIKGFKMEKGLELRYYNFTLKRDMDYALFHPQENAYKLIYLLSNGPALSQLNGTRYAYLYSGDHKSRLTVKRENNVCLIALILNIAWLRIHHSKASHDICIEFNRLLHSNKPALISRKLDMNCFSLIRQMANKLECKTFVPLDIKAGSYVLLHKFLNNNGVQTKRGTVKSEKSLHFKTMTEIEEKLIHAISTKCSAQIRIDNLPQEFNMSLSTLRRHFKIVYGQNIYEYFQKKKMEWAKVELERGNKNISEIARELGFKKAANFSTAYKKEYGILPSKIKQTIMI